MQRFYIYLTDEQQKKIEQTAQITNKPKSEVVRDALDNGLAQNMNAEWIILNYFTSPVT